MVEDAHDDVEEFAHGAFEEFAHEAHMSRAFELAREAGERGDEPFGAVLVRADEIVMEERNAVRTADDIARHPELTLARRAAREFAAEDRSSIAMYTSTEPCSMCAGGIYIAGLGAVAYGISAEAAAEAAGASGHAGEVVPASDVLEGEGSRVRLLGPILPDEAGHIHREHW